VTSAGRTVADGTGAVFGASAGMLDRIWPGHDDRDATDTTTTKSTTTKSTKKPAAKSTAKRSRSTRTKRSTATA
jgi:hypothetical protein